MMIALRCASAVLPAIVAFVIGTPAIAATVVLDKATFLSTPGQRVAATFEDAPLNQLGPFVSGSVSFLTNAMQVTNLLIVPHAHFFGAEGTPPNFLVVSGPTWDLAATFPTYVSGSGFDFNCFACDPVANDSVLEWSTYGPQGNLIESGSVLIDSRPSVGVPRFFGLTTDKPFRTLHVRKRGFTSAFTTWVADDVRMIPARPVEVPTLGSAAMATTGLLIALTALLAYRRNAH